MLRVGSDSAVILEVMLSGHMAGIQVMHAEFVAAQREPHGRVACAALAWQFSTPKPLQLLFVRSTACWSSMPSDTVASTQEVQQADRPFFG